MASPIHQEIEYQSDAATVFQALISAEHFSGFTDAPAEIDPVEGGAFSCFGGQITGRNIEVISGKRLVQAWRVKAWDEGVYSIVRIELEQQGDNTLLTLDHAGFPEAAADHLPGGWHKMYWEPLLAYLS